jgi:hypothetical protein
VDRPAIAVGIREEAEAAPRVLHLHVVLAAEADLVDVERLGAIDVECRLGSGSLDEATAWIEGHRRAWESRLDRFERSGSRTPSTASSARSTTRSE